MEEIMISLDIKERLKGFELKDKYRNIINRKVLIELCDRLYIEYQENWTNAHLATKINNLFFDNGFGEVILWNENRLFWFLENIWRIVEGKYKKNKKVCLL